MTTVDERLAAVEQTLAQIQRQLAVAAPPKNWLDDVVGSILDEAAFREALELGRAFREADRPGAVDDQP